MCHRDSTAVAAIRTMTTPQAESCALPGNAVSDDVELALAIATRISRAEMLLQRTRRCPPVPYLLWESKRLEMNAMITSPRNGVAMTAMRVRSAAGIPKRTAHPLTRIHPDQRIR